MEVEGLPKLCQNGDPFAVFRDLNNPIPHDLVIDDFKEFIYFVQIYLFFYFVFAIWEDFTNKPDDF